MENWHFLHGGLTVNAIPTEREGFKTVKFSFKLEKYPQEDRDEDYRFEVGPDLDDEKGIGFEGLRSSKSQLSRNDNESEKLAIPPPAVLRKSIPGPSIVDEKHSATRGEVTIDFRFRKEIPPGGRPPDSSETLLLIHDLDIRPHAIGERFYRTRLALGEMLILACRIDYGRIQMLPRVGLSFRKLPNHSVFTIIRIEPNSPASQAGLAVGGELTSISGRYTSFLSEQDAFNLLKGEAGTTIYVKYIPPGEHGPREIPLTLRALPTPAPGSVQTYAILIHRTAHTLYSVSRNGYQWDKFGTSGGMHGNRNIQFTVNAKEFSLQLEAEIPNLWLDTDDGRIDYRLQLLRCAMI